MILPIANILQPLIDAAEAVILLLHDDIGLSWGWAIVGLTFLIRILVLPLSIKQIRSMRAMQALQPQLKALQERHKDDRERLQREMMNFYRENKINPFASCLPLLLQLPIFLSLFYLLQSDDFTEDVANNPPVGFGFIESLIEKPQGVELVLLLILFVSTQMIAGIIQTGGRNLEGPQRAIMFILPIAIAPFIIFYPAGLAVYWIATNVWTMGQQFVVMRVSPPPEVPTVEEVQAAKPPPPPPRKKKKRSGRR